jgi:hypothetical protein
LAPTSRIGFATRSSRTSFTPAGPVRHGTRCPMWDRLQPVMAQRLVWVGAARTPSPDVRCGRPSLRSLDADFAPASMPALASNAGSRGTGNPSLCLGEEATGRDAGSAGFSASPLMCFPVSGRQSTGLPSEPDRSTRIQYGRLGVHEKQARSRTHANTAVS